MSVASEFEIERQLITNAYNKLDDLGIDSTGVDKNIENIAEMLDTVYENYPKVTGTGTEVTLDGTKVGKLSLDVKGNSTQETTTGKNKLNPYLRNETTAGVTCTYDEETQTITLNGTCTTDNTTFVFIQANAEKINIPANATLYGLVKYISGSSQGYLALRGFNSGYSRGIAVATTNGLSSDITNTIQFTSDTEFTQMSIRANSDSVFNNLKFKVMFSIVDAVYEKFTYGASPNPSYEQPILSAGDDINLFDKNNIVNDYYLSNEGVAAYNNVWTISNYMTVYKSITYQGLSSVGSAPYSCWYDENKKFLNSFKQQTGENTINVPENAKYVRFSVRKVDVDNFIVKNNIGIITEKIANKNYFDVNMIQERTHNGITMTFDGQTINLKGTATGNANFYRKTGYSIILPAGTYYVQRSSLLNIGTLKLVSGSTTILEKGNTDTTITLNNDTIIDGLTLQVPSAVGTIDKDVVIMICKNDLDTTYVAHQEQTYTIPCQQPMRKIGDVLDEFIQDEEGNWYERHNIARVILNGTENWSLYSESGDASRRFGISYPGYLKPQQALSNYFICEYNDGTNKTTNVLFFNKGGFYLGVTDNINTWDGVQTFKTWLSTHNTEVIYQLATPTDLPCTAEQIAILETLPKSYDEQTNIYSIDVTPAYVEAKALKGE